MMTLLPFARRFCCHFTPTWKRLSDSKALPHSIHTSQRARIISHLKHGRRGLTATGEALEDPGSMDMAHEDFTTTTKQAHYCKAPTQHLAQRLPPWQHSPFFEQGKDCSASLRAGKAALYF
eukprot:6323639-Amphidinium_carterae.1